MKHQVLIVCSANICRSPYAELRLRRALGSPDDGCVEVTSAGIAALDGARMCPTMRNALRERGVTRHADRHRSRSVTADDLAAALILAADRSVLTALLRLNPEVRRRAFTLTQAAHLASTMAPPSPQAMAELVDRLHRARERTSASSYPPIRVARWRRTPGDPLDVPDAHVQDVSHRPILRALTESVDRLALSLRTVQG